MSIDKLWVKNFRNFEDRVFSFSDGVSVVVGDNATGKTNILEGIYLLSFGKSFKARLTEEMVYSRAQVGRAKGLFVSEDGEMRLEVVLTRGEIVLDEKSGSIGKAPRKRMLVNDVPRRLYNYVGNFKVVLFGPWDMDLVTESPSLRRRFLDSTLSLVDREYARRLLSYEKGLRQRNRLLLKIREEGGSRSQLMFWDRLLIKNGQYLTEKRGELIECINESKKLDGHKFMLDYDRSVISETRIEQYKKEEVAAATTLVGPHRDDFCFRVTSHGSDSMKNRDLARYGSRGEQRMGVLWLKMAELSYLQKESGDSPTLLLDDIFSELDVKHKKIVLKLIRGQQTIITTADKNFLKSMEDIEVIKL